MKGCSLVLLCFLGVGANAADARIQTAASSSGNEPRMEPAVFVAPTAGPGSHRRKPMMQASLGDIGGGVIEMSNASALVPERSTTAQANDAWLTALAALGLVALQLRRKHKSLPQRRIAPYA